MTAARPAEPSSGPPSAAASQVDSPSERVARAVERMLRPLVRLLVGRVACIYVIHRLKRLYVEEARRWLERTHPEQRVTRSRLAMLTGLDTRTIAAMEQDPDNESLLPNEVCAGSVVLDRWVNRKEFQDRAGAPAPLPFMGPGRTFQALTARAVGRNITAHTLLDALLESGNVRIDDDEVVHLVDPVYQPLRPSEQTSLEIGSHSIARLTSTIIHNLDAEPGARRLQQERFSRLVPADRHEELQARARALLEQHVETMNALLDEYECHELEDAADPAAVKPLGVGWYVFE
jgi:hypothetical protein